MTATLFDNRQADLFDALAASGGLPLDQPPSRAMRWAEIEQEEAIAQAEADAEAETHFACADCEWWGHRDHAQPIDGRDYCRGCSSKRRTVETLLWGKREACFSGRFFEVRLVRESDGSLSVAGDYSMPNRGGCSGLGERTFATRDEAVTEAMRQKLREVAKHLAVYNGGDSMYGKASDYRALARWCIEQGPPAMFGGADLAGEYEQMQATYQAREKLRCAAIRANAQEYEGEDGKVRNIYSL